MNNDEFTGNDYRLIILYINMGCDKANRWDIQSDYIKGYGSKI